MSTKTASSKYVVSQKEEEDDNDDDEDDSNIEEDDEENKIQEEDMMQIKELEAQLHKVISVDNDQESEEDLLLNGFILLMNSHQWIQMIGFNKGDTHEYCVYILS